jgi:hypothetical protein
MTSAWPTFPSKQAPRFERMLITKHFAFVHVPRTGGNFIRDVCFEHLPSEWLIRNALPIHTPYDELAHDFSDLPMVCFVRNPWDWYVSWYHHQTQHYPFERSGRMWMTAFAGGRNDFRQTVWNCCTGENFENPTTGPIMRELDVDHYTARFIEMTGSGIETGRLEVGRYERLRGDFRDFLERHDVPVGDDFLARLAEDSAKHASERGPYRDYYDEELRDLVGRKARLLIERFGYEF